jgi:hypothetical protein
VRLTDKPPFACSSCAHRWQDRQHVDFEAAWDGPVLEGFERKDNIPLDDLIVCEECVREAAQLLGLTARGDLKALKEDNKRLEAELADARSRLRDLAHAVREGVPA